MAFFTSLKTNYPVLTHDDFKTETEDKDDSYFDDSVVSSFDNVSSSIAIGTEPTLRTPSNTRESERRFSYEVDPDIGVIV